MLLVVNPTQDLPGAEEERNRILSMAGRHQGIHVSTILQGQATKPRLAEEFASGKYDLVYYAGHAYFDEASEIKGVSDGLKYFQVPIQNIF